MPFDAHVSPDASGAPQSTPQNTQPGTQTGAQAGRQPGTTPNAPQLQSVANAEPAQASTGREPVAVAPIWLQRTSLIVLVLFCIYLGALVTILPWWTKVWDHNPLLLSRPTLAAVLRNGAVRGFISGLGLLDIWIGISEAIHYRDHR